jgi:hypothetical protein
MSTPGDRIMSGTVMGAPKILLRLEALFVLIAASTAYARLGASWWKGHRSPKPKRHRNLSARKSVASAFCRAHPASPDRTGRHWSCRSRVSLSPRLVFRVRNDMTRGEALPCGTRLQFREDRSSAHCVRSSARLAALARPTVLSKIFSSSPTARCA